MGRAGDPIPLLCCGLLALSGVGCGGDEEGSEPRADTVQALRTQSEGALERAVSLVLFRSEGERELQVSELLNVELTGYRSSGLPSNRALATAPSEPPAGMRAGLLEDDAINTGLDNPGQQAGLSFRFVTVDGIPSSISNREGPDLFIFELGLPGGVRGDGGFAALPGDPVRVRGTGLDSDRFADFFPGQIVQVGADRRVMNVERFSNVAADAPASSVLSLEALEQVELQSLGRSGLSLYALAVDLDALGFEEGDSVQGLELQRVDGVQSPDPCLILGIPDTVSR